MKKFFCFLILGITLALDESHYRFLFEEFRVQNGKIYADAHEALMRYEIFKHNIEKINDLSKKVSCKLGITPFTDMTEKEFKNFVGDPKSEEYLNDENRKAEEHYGDNISISDLPDEVDWVKKKAVSPPRQQFQCKSSWAMAISGAVEGLWVAKRHEDLELHSPQNLIDCVSYFCGCASECDMSQGYNYVKSDGTCLEEHYRQKTTSESCHDGDCRIRSFIGGYSVLPNNKEDHLQLHLSQQPVAVYIATTSTAFQFYKGGILGNECTGDANLNVLATGYGIDKGIKYYTIKNSWGSGWGESGFARIQRDTLEKYGVCRITRYMTIPVEQ